ncbi:RHO protein signal transduction [Scheffersomyces amazonensis]|uniref:RHO protein signal transduction n=1 Tax=Scheffersomyces amazonensis TaxID=1078765 RepID=UPI00315DBCF3
MTSGSVYISIKQFNARLGDELSLKVGDKVEVLADDSEYNDGWFMGKNLLTNEVGLYPKSFTQILQQPTNPDKSLLRSRSRRVASGNSTNSTINNSNNTNNGSSSGLGTPILKVNQITDSVEQLDIKNNSPEPLANSTRTEDLNPHEAYKWTPQQVSSYFSLVLGFDLEIAGKFARHKITGAILFELDLAHLKELDIDSFGTRFEIYKEIEKLKELSEKGGKSKIKAPPVPPTKIEDTASSNSEDDFQSPNVTPYSKSKEFDTKLMPSAPLTTSTSTNSFYKNHQRKRSQSMENLSFIDDLNSNLFTSPRKAPQPPTDSPMNEAYKFGSGPVLMAPTPQDHGIYRTRSHASSLLQLSRPSSSVYEQSVMSNHKKSGSQVSGNGHGRGNSSSSNNNHHKRHSSLFSFLSVSEEKPLNTNRTNNLAGSQTPKGDLPKLTLTSPVNLKQDNVPSAPTPYSPRRNNLNGSIPNRADSPSDLTIVDIDNVQLSPKKGKSGSTPTYSKPDLTFGRDERRSASDSPGPIPSRLKGLRTVSAQNLKNITASRKSKTSAFTEGIREISPDEAIKSASYSGWMSKKSGNALSWRSRYFTLHGTRLSYFASLKDKREKGLIDITAHKVIPISTETDEFSERSDKYTALIASSTFSGSYCFKLVPPAPGFKKGLTFTQPKTHYFAVESEDELRGWMKALMSATIDIDDSVPVVSSCSTPTVSLSKAQELLARAREETKLKDEELRAQGFQRGSTVSDDFNQFLNDTTNDFATSVDSGRSHNDDSTADTSIHPPKLSLDTSSKGTTPKTPSTPHVGGTSSTSGPGHSSLSGGFASPYLLASGLLSPKSGNASSSPTTATTPGSRTASDFFPDVTTGSTLTNDSSSTTNSTINTNTTTNTTTPKSIFSNSNGRILSGSRKKLAGEKLMAYSSDGTGNHSFVIKAKR